MLVAMGLQVGMACLDRLVIWDHKVFEARKVKWGTQAFMVHLDSLVTWGHPDWKALLVQMGQMDWKDKTVKGASTEQMGFQASLDNPETLESMVHQVWKGREGSSDQMATKVPWGITAQMVRQVRQVH
jgi:hypothetical protein